MIWLLIVSVGLLVTCDQLIKHWAYVNLQPVGEMSIIDGFFQLTYAENRGAAFGILQGGRWFFVPLTIIVGAVIVYYYLKLPRTRAYWPVRIPLIFIMAGTVGNFIDRLLNGYVIDLFEFKFITFPIFNMADMMLIGGSLVLAFVVLFVMREKI